MSDSVGAFYRGRTVLVTGASSGIGADMARRLGAAGARVLLVARSADRLAAVAEEVRQRGGAAVAIAADLEPPGAAAALADRLAAAGEKVDVLVNNAGFGLRGTVAETAPEAAEAMIGLNVTALTGLTHRLLPGMVARGRGGVLNVASLGAFAPSARFAVYTASKAYVLAFSEALWAETRGTGVHVSCLCPGPVPTGFGGRAGMRGSFFDAGVTSDDAAQAGLAALGRDDRRVVPGWFQKLQVEATRFVPRRVVLEVGGAKMRRAG